MADGYARRLREAIDIRPGRELGAIVEGEGYELWRPRYDGLCRRACHRRKGN